MFSIAVSYCKPCFIWDVWRVVGSWENSCMWKVKLRISEHCGDNLARQLFSLIIRECQWGFGNFGASTTRKNSHIMSGFFIWRSEIISLWGLMLPSRKRRGTTYIIHEWPSEEMLNGNCLVIRGLVMCGLNGGVRRVFRPTIAVTTRTAHAGTWQL